MRYIILLAAVLLPLLSGCTLRGVITMPDERIWVVLGKNTVYRCAEVNKSGKPTPVCVIAKYE